MGSAGRSNEVFKVAMTNNQFIAVKAYLNMFPEVTWDRYSGSKTNLEFFGWIDREDEYKDFMVLMFEMDNETAKPTSFTTSSAKYSPDFSKRLSWGHDDCQRVEDLFLDGVKVVKI